MLVTSSYPSWLIDILAKYLEAGRVQPMDLSPYLSPAAGLEAVHHYAQWLEVEITNETALQINELCFSDPFFISCVIDSESPGKDLTTTDGVIDVVKHEISRKSEMSRTWEEYLFLTLQQVNNRHAKSLLLFLHKYPDRYWTAKELKEKLSIADLTVAEIQQRLEALSKTDLIERDDYSNRQFRGLQDGTLHLVIRTRLEEEINDFTPDLKQEFHETLKILKSENWRLRGQLNQLKGRVAEYWLAKAMRKRQRFALSEFFQQVKDTTELHLTLVQEQVRFKRGDGKEFELDVVATDQSGRVVLVEVKKTQEKIGRAVMETFWEKVQVYQQGHPEAMLLPAFLSLGGFTEEAMTFAQAQGIAMTEQLEGE